MKPRPVGRCALCGKPIWARSELRRDGAGLTTHIDCRERPNTMTPTESMAAAGFTPGRVVGRIDGRYYPDGIGRDIAEKDDVVYERPDGDRVWRVSYRKQAASGRSGGSERA